MLDSLPLFFMSISLVLSWWNLIASIAYPCPSMNHLDHRHFRKASSATNISYYAELLPFIFCFHGISINDRDPVDIIALVCPFQYSCTIEDAPTHHLMTLRMSYLINITIFPQPYSYGIINRAHSKVIAILISFLALDVKNSICDTVWRNDLA